MFVINDIELLTRLSDCLMLKHLTGRCELTISNVRLHEYSSLVIDTVRSNKELIVSEVEQEGFDMWLPSKRKHLTIGELSSIYVALSRKSAVLVLSVEDEFLMPMVKSCGLTFLKFDQFIISQIQDQRIINLFKQLKVA